MCNNCVKILINRQEKRSWEEQKLDWTMKPSQNIEYDYYHSVHPKKDLVKTQEMPSTVNYCICGHLIVNKFPVYNDKRKLCYVMGSVCICRYKKNDKSNHGAFIGNQLIETQLTELNKYKCETCNKMMSKDNIDKHNNSPRHIKNYLIKNYRKCRVCDQYEIQVTKPTYYHTCSGCYKFKPKY